MPVAMQVLYLNILILVLHTTNAFENGMENKTIRPSLKHCSRIKCPPVHKPICAKIVNIETKNEVIVILVNKCEMNYVKCYSGIQAKVVPMKYCSQFYKNNEVLEAKRIRNNSDNGRVKRDLRRHGGPARAQRGGTRFGGALRAVIDDGVNEAGTMPLQEYEEHDVETDVSGNYQFIRVTSKCVTFSVKTNHDANIILSSTESTDDPTIKVILGGWDNQRSALYHNKEKAEKTQVNTPNILNINAFRDFWVSWDHNVISVMRDNEKVPFMSWKDTEPFVIGQIGVRTRWGSPGTWKIEEKGKETIDIQTVSNAQYKYNNVSSTSVRVQVKATNDAYIALTSYPQDPENMIEIYIGAYDNQKSLIRKAWTESETPNILDPNNLKGFWICWNNGIITVGNETTRKIPFLSSHTRHSFPVKYVGLSTTGGAKGTWKIKESDYYDPDEEKRKQDEEKRKQDRDNYDVDCPSVCPARAVMVCGRCKHGAYVTFLSVCHMRMQHCLYKHESIELVARYPCAISAPLLTGQKPNTQSAYKILRNTGRHGPSAHAQRDKYINELHTGRRDSNDTDAVSQVNDQDGDRNEAQSPNLNHTNTEAEQTTEGVKEECVFASPSARAVALPPPEKVVKEPNDEDEVLRYIWCRDHGYQGTYCDKIRNKADGGDRFLIDEDSLYDKEDISDKTNIIYAEENDDLKGSGIQHEERNNDSEHGGNQSEVGGNKSLRS